MNLLLNLKKWQKSSLLMLLCITISGTAYAHHTGAMYDRSVALTLKGTVKELRFTNPHCWIRLVIEDENGKLTDWGIEASAPARLRKFGISPATVKPGDKVTVVTHPLRDGRNGGAFVSMILADGTVVDTATNSAPGYDTPKH